jgi:peptide chain release factor subunit 1
MGVIETLIVLENLGVNHYVLKNAISKGIIIKHLNKDQEVDQFK